MASKGLLSRVCMETCSFSPGRYLFWILQDHHFPNTFKTGGRYHSVADALDGLRVASDELSCCTLRRDTALLAILANASARRTAATAVSSDGPPVRNKIRRHCSLFVTAPLAAASDANIPVVAAFAAGQVEERLLEVTRDLEASRRGIRQAGEVLTQAESEVRGCCT